MTADHTLSVTFDRDTVDLAVVCHAGVAADCRMVCELGCESWNAAEHDHPMSDYGTCNEAEWINATDVEESCATETSFPLNDGMPVTLIWHGDYYTWKPA